MKIDKNLTRASALICVFAIVLSLLTGCRKDNISITGKAFGGSFYVEFSTDTEDTVLSFAALMEKAVSDTQAELSGDDEYSPLFVLNTTGLLYASDFFKKSLQDTILICTALDDTVDISAGRLSRLWGIGTDSPAVPDSKKLQDAVKAVSMDKISIAGNSNKITISDDIEADLSAVIRGIALDSARETAVLCKTPYKLTLGNTGLFSGEGPSDGKWVTEIKNPLSGGGEVIARLRLTPFANSNAVFWSVSATADTSFTEHGKSYHGILDPDTGYPADTDVLLAFVTAESGLQADALADAMIINGFTEKSLTLLRRFSAEAVLVFSDNTYYVTEGLKDSLELTDTSLTGRTDTP